MPSPLEDIVAPQYKAGIRSFAAIAAIVGGLFLLSDRAAAFVDERIRNKTATTDKLIELQMQRLEKMDTRLDEMRISIGEIKTEVVTVRQMLGRQAAK